MDKKTLIFVLPIVYILSRIGLFFILGKEIFYGLGDLDYYYHLSALEGWPYIHYWVEYPPLVPFLLKIVHIISNSDERAFLFFINLILAFSGGLAIVLVQLVSSKIYPTPGINHRAFLYTLFIIGLPYTWWYFDMLPVTMVLAALWNITKRRNAISGWLTALGVLTKWFPILLIPGLVKYRSRTDMLKILCIAFIVIIMVFIGLYLVSPEMTLASLQAQPSRSSWQTIWALIDGNFMVGTIVDLTYRVNPALSNFQMGNPPTISPYLLLLVFASAGIFLLHKFKLGNEKSYVSFVGITWVLFLLWSPGWSPQWILYLIPIIFLTLPIPTAVFCNIYLCALTLSEWPFALGQNMYNLLWIIIPLRILIFVFLIYVWIKQISSENRTDPQTANHTRP